VLENEENQVSRLARDRDGRPLHYTAQWNDDLHHVLHVAATGEDAGYYGEYRGDTRKLGLALAEGFAFQGQIMEFRGSARGEPSGELPPTAFISFIQNHDQIGNRAFGERIGALAVPDALRAIIGVYLLLPQVPMLFMGEEWGASQPFPFFCDFSGDLADAVRKGRREEFAKFPEFQDEAQRRRIPDPQADETFTSAKLAWGDLDDPPHAAWHAYYTTLLSIRRETIVPLLPGIGGSAARFEVIGAGAVIVRWLANGATLTLACNLSDRAVAGFPPMAGRVLWQVGGGSAGGASAGGASAGGEPADGELADGTAGPWTVRWTIEHAERS
jgi:maltooligosyltrehalose trehalohydrolase